MESKIARRELAIKKQLLARQNMEKELRLNKITMKILSQPNIELLERVCISNSHKFPTVREFVKKRLYENEADNSSESDSNSTSESDSYSDSSEDEEYNERFIKECVERFANEYFELGLISLGAKEYNYKMPLSAYQQYMQKRRPQIKDERPGLKNTEYMELVAEEWKALKKKESKTLSAKEKLDMEKKREQLSEDEWATTKENENLIEVNFEKFIGTKVYKPNKNQSVLENKKYVRFVYNREWTLLTSTVNRKFITGPPTGKVISKPLTNTIKSDSAKPVIESTNTIKSDSTKSTTESTKPTTESNKLTTESTKPITETIKSITDTIKPVPTGFPTDLIEQMALRNIRKIEIKENSTVIEFTNL